MAIQTLTSLETAAASGAFFNFGFDFASLTGTGSGEYVSPFGTFTGTGFGGPAGGGRNVGYSGIFGTFGNDMSFTEANGFDFSYIFEPAF